MSATSRTVTDDLNDTLLRHQVMLQRLTEGERRKFVPFLKQMDADIRDKLTRAELTTYSRDRLEKLLTSVDDMLATTLSDYQKRLLSDVDDIAKNEAAFTAKAMRVVVEADAVAPAVAQIRELVLRDPLSIKGNPLLKPFISDWTISERKAVGGAIRRGVFQGQTNAQIIKAIRGTAALNYQDGLLDVTARHAAAVVHTAVQHASSMARQATVAENADIVASVKWISTLDKITCAQCRSLDSQVFKIDRGPRPPIHPNCRCTVVFVLADKYAALQAGGTRASAGADGGAQISADISYYEWLRTQPKEFVIAALGAKRAQLFLRGGISAQRFAALQLDRNFEPLTLAEMKALEPVAFMRAGVKV